MSATLPPTSSTIRIRDLRFRYPGSAHEILRIPSLDIGGRGLIALTGPSGAGKSTLVELLAGTLREEYDGSVEVLGTELKSLTSDAARQRHIRRIGFIPQDYGLLPGRTVSELLHQDLDDAQVPRAEQPGRIIAALKQVGLLEFANRPSNQLSGGQRQRVAIARMLARDVEMVVADEPTANLDPRLTDEIIDLLRTLGQRVSVIIVTHDSRVAEMCDRTIVLQSAAVWDSTNVLASTTNGDHGINGLSRRAWIAIAASIVLGLGFIVVAVAENRVGKGTRLTTPTTGIQQVAQAPATLSGQSIAPSSPGALVQQQVTVAVSPIPNGSSETSSPDSNAASQVQGMCFYMTDPHAGLGQQYVFMSLQGDGCPPPPTGWIPRAGGPPIMGIGASWTAASPPDNKPLESGGNAVFDMCDGYQWLPQGSGQRSIFETHYYQGGDRPSYLAASDLCMKLLPSPHPIPATPTATIAITTPSPVPSSQPPITSIPSLTTPSVTEIAFEMSRTVESGSNTEHFTPGPTTGILDGSGGTLTAAVGVRFPTADGYGQLVFFWHNDDFLGWNATQETISIEQIESPASGVFDVTYAQYAPTDPMSSPSLPPVTIAYRWNGSSLESNGTPPNLSGSVQLLP